MARTRRPPAPATLNLADPLRRLHPVQVKVELPRAAEMGLEELVSDLLKRKPQLGDSSRGELLGALILEAAQRPTRLPGLVARYRSARVHQILLSQTKKTGRVSVPRRRLGRPKR